MSRAAIVFQLSPSNIIKICENEPADPTDVVDDFIQGHQVSINVLYIGDFLTNSKDQGSSGSLLKLYYLI